MEERAKTDEKIREQRSFVFEMPEISFIEDYFANYTNEVTTDKRVLDIDTYLSSDGEIDPEWMSLSVIDSHRNYEAAMFDTEAIEEYSFIY